MTHRHVIIGAGLVGSLLSIYLERAGKKTVVYEKRKDLRKNKTSRIAGEGRSINLAISVRGIHALKQLGLEKEVLEHSIPMKGRKLHALDGEVQFQPYGVKDEHAIYSISRSWLNGFLMDEAEKAGVTLHFEKELKAIDLKNQKIFLDQKTQSVFQDSYTTLYGTDGASSKVRKILEEQGFCNSQSAELTHGYKEFVMDAQESGTFQMESEGLHIWPRGNFMLIALPNFDKSFTCTLFLPHSTVTDSEAPSFENLKNAPDIENFFKTYFNDFVSFVPDFIEQFRSHPTGHMVTIKSERWSDPAKTVLLLGDAAHAIVPFFGQGMNCGFEDCEALQQLSFEDFFNLRKPNTDAIADMAVENFAEMSEKTASPDFLYQKKIEREIQQKFPNLYVSKYSLVSFSRTPYVVAKKIGQIQTDLLEAISREKKIPSEMDWKEVEHLLHSNLELTHLMKQTAQNGSKL